MQLARAVAALAVIVVVAVGDLACEPHVAPPPGPVTGATALYDPLATPPVVPTPNDLAFIGGDGVHLNVRDQPTDSAAQRAFNAYLRTLTGFPAPPPATTHFSSPIDAATATVQTSMMPGSVVVVDTTASALVETATATVSADHTQLDVSVPARFSPGHRYAVLVFGGDDAAGVRAQSGGPVLASPTFFVLRAPEPLVARCADR